MASPPPSGVLTRLAPTNHPLLPGPLLFSAPAHFEPEARLRAPIAWSPVSIGCLPLGYPTCPGRAPGFFLYAMRSIAASTLGRPSVLPFAQSTQIARKRCRRAQGASTSRSPLACCRRQPPERKPFPAIAEPAGAKTKGPPRLELRPFRRK